MNTQKISPSQAVYAGGFPNAEEFRMACERGRHFAAMAVKFNPIKKAEMEALYGIELCRQRWPEAYEGA